MNTGFSKGLVISNTKTKTCQIFLCENEDEANELLHNKYQKAITKTQNDKTVTAYSHKIDTKNGYAVLTQNINNNPESDVTVFQTATITGQPVNTESPENIPITGYLQLYMQFTTKDCIYYAACDMDFHKPISIASLTEILNSTANIYEQTFQTPILKKEYISKETYEQYGKNMPYESIATWDENKTQFEKDEIGLSKITAKDKSAWIYETGHDEPEILGSGSTYSHVYTTADKDKAFEAADDPCRNYLIRYNKDRTKRQWWDNFTKKWIDD